MENLSDLASSVAGTIIARLRDEHPFMSIEAVLKAAVACGAMLDKTVKEQESHIEAAKSCSSFSSLSPELRNSIYELALIRPHNPAQWTWTTPSTTQDGQHSIATTPSQPIFIGQYVNDGWEQQPALTRISRQIRSESLPVYYGSNTFFFSPQREYRNPTLEGCWGWPKELKPLIDHMNEVQSPIDRENYLPVMKTAVTWLKTIGSKNANLIRKVVVQELGWSHDEETRRIERDVIASQLRAGGLEFAEVLAAYGLRGEMVIIQHGTDALRGV